MTSRKTRAVARPKRVVSARGPAEDAAYQRGVESGFAVGYAMGYAKGYEAGHDGRAAAVLPTQDQDGLPL